MAKHSIEDSEPSPEVISQVMTALGRRGGKAKVSKGYAKLTEEDRKERAREGAAARWGNRDPKKSRVGARRQKGVEVLIQPKTKAAGKRPPKK